MMIIDIKGSSDSNIILLNYIATPPHGIWMDIPQSSLLNLIYVFSACFYRVCVVFG